MSQHNSQALRTLGGQWRKGGTKVVIKNTTTLEVMLSIPKKKLFASELQEIQRSIHDVSHKTLYEIS